MGGIDVRAACEGDIAASKSAVDMFYKAFGEYIRACMMREAKAIVAARQKVVLTIEAAMDHIETAHERIDACFKL